MIMKTKVFAALVFVVLFMMGLYFTGKLMPQDETILTLPYQSETDIFTAPDTSKADKFDPGGMALATIGMVGFKQMAFGNQNFMKTSVVGDG